MAWYNPVDIAGKLGGYLAGTDSANKTSKFTPPARDADASSIWNDFMSSYGGLKENISGEQNYLTQKFGDYMGSANAARGTYQNTIASLTSKLQDPNSQVSFGLQGSSPVSFTPRQTREDISTLEQIAGKNMATALASPTEQMAFDTQNNPYAANQKYFDIISALNKAAEDRRYQIATQSTNTADTSKVGILDFVTSLGKLGQTVQQLGSLGTGLPSIGMG